MNLGFSCIYQLIIDDIFLHRTWEPQLIPEALSLAIMVLTQVYSL